MPDGARFCPNCGVPQYYVNNKETIIPDFSYQELVNYDYDAVEQIQHVSCHAVVGGNNYNTSYYILLHKGNKVGLADKSFTQLLLPCSFESIEIFDSYTDGAYYKTYNEGVTGLYNKGSLIVESSEYDILVKDFGPSSYFVLRYFKGKYGVRFYNRGLERFSMPLYDQVREINDHTVKIQVGFHWGLINYLGSELPPIFDDIEYDSYNNILRLVFNHNEYVFKRSNRVIEGIVYKGFDTKNFGVFFKDGI